MRRHPVALPSRSLTTAPPATDPAACLVDPAYCVCSISHAQLEVVTKRPGTLAQVPKPDPTGRPDLVCASELDGRPLLTFTAPTTMREVTVTSPSEAYLRMLATGLSGAHRWGPAQSAAYLLKLPGASGTWTPAALEALCADTATSPSR